MVINLEGTAMRLDKILRREEAIPEKEATKMIKRGRVAIQGEILVKIRNSIFSWKQI